MNKKLIFIFTIFISMLLSGIVSAQPASAGIVIAVQGNAYAQNQAGARRLLHRRDGIYVNEVITTGDGSKMTLMLKDETILTLLPDTEYSVQAMKFDDKNPQNSQYVGNFVKGALFTISGAGNPKNHELKTPLTTIGVRGTKYLVYTGSKWPL